jgi:hypothetical protein
MDLFNLPPTAIVNRVVPKNAFDSYATARQKKMFTNLVLRITWTHKLSSKTINLDGTEIKEIQLFRIELKEKEDIRPVLEIIDKAIPYPIIFVVVYEGGIYLSTSPKHPHPVKADNCVIDWTFKTDWLLPVENKYHLNLQKNLDAIYQDFCAQLSGNAQFIQKPIEELVAHSRLIDGLQKEISRLKASIANSQQFKQKVELNMRLKEVEAQLGSILKQQQD